MKLKSLFHVTRVVDPSLTRAGAQGGEGWAHFSTAGVDCPFSKVSMPHSRWVELGRPEIIQVMVKVPRKQPSIAQRAEPITGESEAVYKRDRTPLPDRSVWGASAISGKRARIWRR